MITVTEELTDLILENRKGLNRCTGLLLEEDNSGEFVSIKIKITTRISKLISYHIKYPKALTVLQGFKILTTPKTNNRSFLLITPPAF